MYKLADKWDAKDLMDEAFKNIRDYMRANQMFSIYKVIPLVYSFATEESELRQWMIGYGQLKLKDFEAVLVFDLPGSPQQEENGPLDEIGHVSLAVLATVEARWRVHNLQQRWV